LRQWRSRRDDRERRRRASFSEHLQQIKRGRVGPELPCAGLCALPALDEDREIVFATDKPRLHSSAGAPAAAAGAHDPV
jgi:hypothetical protein